MSEVSSRRVRIGVLGCGPIAQAVHLEACRKARNAELAAICDVAAGLREPMAAIHRPRSVYARYEDMLDDRQVDAILIAISDEFHVEAASRAIDAGKHVLVEKPLGLTVESCLDLMRKVEAAKELVFQIGHNRRFDPGLGFAQGFIREEIGQLIALRAWYHDSTLRYKMTDNLQPVPVRSDSALRPQGNPKADRSRYFLLTHGSHLVDTARFLGGKIEAVRARLLERCSAWCWFIDVCLAGGTLGHLVLHVPVRGDFEEGFRIEGEGGSVIGRLFHPWFYKAGEVECFRSDDGQYRRILGEDGHTYRRQIEGFADAILDGAPQIGANIIDGVESIRALVAISRSIGLGAGQSDWVRLDEVTGGV